MMEKFEFLKKIETELKISKSSEYTLRNYLNANKNLLDFLNKDPEEVTEGGVKLFLAENLSDKAATSTILFLAAIKYAFTTILKKDITINIKRPKKENRLPTIISKNEVKRFFETRFYKIINIFFKKL